MKHSRILIATAVLSFSVSSAAQHGHSAMGGSSHAMGHQPTSHGSSKADGASSTHGKSTIDSKLSSNTKLAGKIQTLTGMDAQSACSGFKNLGQCVAAAHVSKNLGIKFADLKDDMLGLNPDGTTNTSAKPMSLGKAIQTLQPTADSKMEVKKANQQAQDDTKTS